MIMSSISIECIVFQPIPMLKKNLNLNFGWPSDATVQVSSLKAMATKIRMPVKTGGRVQSMQNSKQNFQEELAENQEELNFYC